MSLRFTNTAKGKGAATAGGSTPAWNGDPPRPAINPQAEIHLFGQAVNPETWAVSKSDIFIKDPSGRDADKVAFGRTCEMTLNVGTCD